MTYSSIWFQQALCRHISMVSPETEQGSVLPWMKAWADMHTDGMGRVKDGLTSNIGGRYAAADTIQHEECLLQSTGLK